MIFLPQWQEWEIVHPRTATFALTKYYKSLTKWPSEVECSGVGSRSVA